VVDKSLGVVLKKKTELLFEWFVIIPILCAMYFPVIIIYFTVNLFYKVFNKDKYDDFKGGQITLQVEDFSGRIE